MPPLLLTLQWLITRTKTELKRYTSIISWLQWRCIKITKIKYRTNCQVCKGNHCYWSEVNQINVGRHFFVISFPDWPEAENQLGQDDWLPAISRPHIQILEINGGEGKKQLIMGFANLVPLELPLPLLSAPARILSSFQAGAHILYTTTMILMMRMMMMLLIMILIVMMKAYVMRNDKLGALFLMQRGLLIQSSISVHCLQDIG